MRKLLLPLCFILFTACNHISTVKEKQLADTLERLRKHAAYQPLDSAETYNFINKYYLPRLDTLHTGRKIFIYPLIGRDFKKIFKDDSTRLVAEYSRDTINTRKTVLQPPPIMDFSFNEKYGWNNKKLLNTEIISDTSLVNQAKYPRHPAIEEVEAWHRKFHSGYICISYPQYNPYTKRLLIREWIESGYGCGTGRYNTFGFTKIPGGWKAD